MLLYLRCCCIRSSPSEPIIQMNTLIQTWKTGQKEPYPINSMRSGTTLKDVNFSVVLHTYPSCPIKNDQIQLTQFIRWFIDTDVHSKEGMWTFERYKDKHSQYHVHLLIHSTDPRSTYDLLKSVWSGNGTVKMEPIRDKGGVKDYVSKYHQGGVDLGDFVPLTGGYFLK